jgi:ATP-dependent helicase/nuclease subunit A
MPVDEAARRRVRHDHEVSLVVAAGAGTGKTTLLVDRIEELVRTGRAGLDEIVAVTYTENAAATLKLRLRERLERARVKEGATPEERGRAERALEVLERAMVCTIHALCAAMLAERPVDCGITPGFRVADEGQAEVLFAAAWDEWLAERLAAGDEALVAALEADIPLEGEFVYEKWSLRHLARRLIEERDLQPLVAEPMVDAEGWKAELSAKAAEAEALLPGAPAGDALATALQGLVAFAEEARPLSGAECLRHLMRLGEVKPTIGQKVRWGAAFASARALAAWTGEALRRWRAARSADLHGRLVRALEGVAAAYADKKTAHGVLDYADLLVKARDALRDRPAVRAYFRRRFRALIIDEFQDTDPLQVEIAELLAGDAPGCLVVVGDAKQSIYRFRRAEVAQFRRLAEEAARRPSHAVAHLVQNFRSRPAILRVVNRAFGRLIQASEQTGQPPYEDLAPPPGLDPGRAVVALRYAADEGGQPLLRAEARALAACLAEAARGRFEVRDPTTGETRPSRAGDVMVLARRLTHARLLEEALEDAGLKATVEGGRSFFDRAEVHETLSVLRAIEDPTDRVALVAALRSSYFGVSDRDIVTYVVHGGRLSMEEVEERPGAAALRPALELLKELHGRRLRLSVPALLERLYDDTRILAALTGTRRGEAQIANLEKVAALARQAGELGVLTLRGFIRLLEARVETAREEPDLPATRPGDPETVRVLTIHRAKGLEAPIVAVFDTDDACSLMVDAVPLRETRAIAVGFRPGCQPPGWDQLKQGEQERLWAEAIRLQYVACTRARDLLVLPCPPPDLWGRFWRGVLTLLPEASDDCVEVIDASTLPAPTPDREPEAPGREDVDAAGAVWDRARAERLARAGARDLAPVSAVRAAARHAPPAVSPAGDVREPGRGRDFGVLVHRVLEWLPLDEQDARTRAAAMARALAPSFNLDEAAAGRAADAVARVMELPVMQRARRAPRRWRELALWFPDGEDLVEGVVDLVFEEDDGLVVVDYKTDAIGAAQAIAQAAHHAPQLQLYGRGLAQATGQPVRERLVVFTATGQAVPV